MTDNNKYLIKEAYSPQSRYDNMEGIEPEFWKHKKLDRKSVV